jgi:hypothetical protein
MTNDENADENASPLIFETRVVQDGYSYWRSKFNEGRLPSRSDINPIDIPRLMPHAVMVDVKREPEYDFRYRLIGTYVAEHLFTDHTGSWFSEIDHQKAPSQIWQNCKHVVESGEAFLAATPYVGPHRDYRQVEDVILPLAADGIIIDTLLVFVCYTARTDS